MESSSYPSGDEELKLKAVILVGGPAKGTRFRPLSLEIPKPLFPVAGYPIIHHHIQACCLLLGMKEILLIGFYQPSEDLTQFIYNAQQEFKIQIRYLQEFTSLGTAGGIYHFRDQILSGAPHFFFVMNADVCCDFPLKEMLTFHRSIADGDHFTILATEATHSQSKEYGCIVENRDTNEVLHYVEKPSTFVSTSINCGIYLFTPSIFKFIRIAFLKHQEENFNFDFTHQCKETVHLEKEVFQPLAGTGKLFVYHTDRFWSQIKSAGAAIYANRHYLKVYQQRHPERLAKDAPEGPTIVGDVYIHPSATIHPSAVLGPNVSIGRHANIGAGVRVRESIILQGATVRSHSCVLNAVVGWGAILGEWTRVEGTPNDPNPNKPFTKLEMLPMFNLKGQLNPSVTVIGSYVEVPRETVVLNCIVLPHKELERSYKNEIIL